MEIRNMKRLIVLTFGLLLPSLAFAQSADCLEGQVEKCFVDGDNTQCVCMAEPEEVAENPESEPDGFENPDE
jgi:hypothetical protein